MKKIKVAVIGGGASGMMAAITAAEQGAAVFLYEGNDRVGKKFWQQETENVISPTGIAPWRIITAGIKKE